MTATTTTSSNRSLLKTIPGLLISAFFLWYTFRGISFAHILALRIAHLGWALGVLGFTPFLTAWAYQVQAVLAANRARGSR